VYAVPEETDREIARLKLASMGIAIDVPTPEQQKYMSSWEEGPWAPGLEGQPRPDPRPDRENLDVERGFRLGLPRVPADDEAAHAHTARGAGKDAADTVA